MSYYVVMFPTWFVWLQLLYLELAILHTTLQIIISVPEAKKVLEGGKV